MHAYRESTPSTELTLVANCGRETVSSDDLDGAEPFFNKTVDRNRLPYRVLSPLIDLDGCLVVLGIGDHGCYTTEGTIVVRPA